MKRDPMSPELWAKLAGRRPWWLACYRCRQEFRRERHFRGRLRFLLLHPTAELCLACAEELLKSTLPPGALRGSEVEEDLRKAAGRYFRDWKPWRPPEGREGSGAVAEGAAQSLGAVDAGNSRETEIQAFDPLDPEAVLDAIIELGARVSALERWRKRAIKLAPILGEGPTGGDL